MKYIFYAICLLGRQDFALGSHDESKIYANQGNFVEPSEEIFKGNKELKAKLQHRHDH